MTSFPFNDFRKKILNLLVPASLLVFSLFFFLYFVRLKFKNYLKQIAQFTAESQAIQQGLSAGTITPYDTQAFLDKFWNLTSNALFFGYFVVPVVIFLLIVVFESIIFKMIRDGNLDDFKEYFKKFFMIMLAASVAGIAIAYPILRTINGLSLTEASTFTTSPLLFLILIAIGIMLFYFTLITLCRIREEKVFRTFRDSVVIGLRKFWRLFPLNLVLMILSAMLLFFFSILFTSFTLQTEIWLSATTDIILIIASLVAILFMQNLFFHAVKKHSS